VNDESRDPLSHAVLGAAFEVANILGYGFLEAVYRRALVREMIRRDIPVREEVPFPVFYKGDEVGRYFADIVAADKMIVELKCAEALSPSHLAQTLNYLKASRIPAALLINFAKPRIEYRRVVLSKP
jgi:GxxExxY protein